jgi:hypothetical protein
MKTGDSVGQSIRLLGQKKQKNLALKVEKQKKLWRRLRSTQG